MFLSKRNGVYYVFYLNDKGKRTCISTKAKLKTDANKFLIRFKDEIELRRAQKFIPINLKDFANQFRSYSVLVHSYATGKDYQGCFNKLVKSVGNIDLIDLTESVLTDYLRARNKISVYTSSKDLRYFRSAFNWAVRQKYLITNPCANIKPIRVPEKQPLFLNESDYKTLLSVITNKDIKDFVIFAINTGLRLNEILSLEWRQVNFKDRYVILDNINHVTKSKRIRAVPLNLNALQVLNERQIESKSQFAFTMNNEKLRGEYVSKQFKKYVIKASIDPKIHVHSLRHSFASNLVQKGVSIYQVSKLLGHSDLRVTSIYSHLTPENLKNAVDLLII